jgi:basic amino acid/polyamine antiporter, APA family
LAAVLLFALENAIGHQFFASMSYAFYALPSALPFPVQPSVNLFVGMLTGNPTVTVLAALGTIAIGISLTAILYPMLTRSLFAWSFDRLVPAKLSEVYGRYGTPHVAVLVCSAIGLVSLAINSFILPSLFATISIVTVYSQIFFNFTIVSVAAILFPFRKRDVYNASPARRLHPLLVIAGFASLLVFAWAGFEYFTDPLYGIIGVAWENIYLVAIFAIPFVAYFVIRAVRKAQGIDLATIFAEIPPE